MTHMAPRPERLAHYAGHPALGFDFLVLLVLRLLWRWFNPVPIRWTRDAAEDPRPCGRDRAVKGIRSGSTVYHHAPIVMLVSAIERVRCRGAADRSAIEALSPRMSDR
jgi:hypothetical protein